MIRRFVPLLALALLGTAPAGRASTVAELAQLHRTYVGWAAPDASPAYTARGTIVRSDGKVAGSFTAVHQGKRWRMSVSPSDAAVSFSQGFDGQHYWRTNANGFIRWPNLSQVQVLALDDLIENEAVPYEEASIAGKQTVGGAPCSILHVETRGVLPFDLYIDEQTGAYRRLVIEPRSARITVDYLSYADLPDGTKVAGTVRTGGLTFAVEHVQAETVSDEMVGAPKPSAKWTFAGGRVPIPLRSDGSGMFVTAKVNGVEGRFTIDTGASSIVLSDGFAVQAGVKRLGAGDLAGLAGAEKSAIWSVDSFALGSNVLSNVVVTSTGSALNKHGSDGVIGYDVFAGAILSLDLDKGIAYIDDPQAVEPAIDGATMLRADLSQRIPIVPMRVNDTVEISGHLDTGFYSALLFSYDLVTRNNVTFISNESGSLKGVGSGAQQPVRCGSVTSLSAGSARVAGPAACMLMEGEAYNLSSRDAVVGYGFLKCFNLVIDYPDSAILFYPRRTDPPPTQSDDTVNLGDIHFAGLRNANSNGPQLDVPSAKPIGRSH